MKTIYKVVLNLSLVIIAIICLALCYKWGDWKNWKLYYSTMLFYIIGGLTENIVTSQKPLWLFHGSYAIDRLVDYLFGFLIFPCITILFLSNYPKSRIRQIAYLSAFTFVMSLVEYMIYIHNEIEYYNGWTIGWSVLLYAGVFLLLRLHYKNPLWAWLILFGFICGGMFYFKIPLISLK